MSVEQQHHFDIVVVGSCNVDLVCYSDVIPKTGETVIGTRFASGQGGKGANQAVAAARLGARVAMVSKVGYDQFGRNFIEALKADGIDTHHVTLTKTAHTGMASIIVDRKGDNTIIIIPGANLDVNENDIDAAKPLIQNARVVVVQLELRPEIVSYALQIAKQRRPDGRPPPITIVNPAPAIEPSRFPKEIYRLADYFCPNETETATFLGRDHLDVNDDAALASAADEFKRRGCNGNILLTLGSKGVFVGGKIIPPPKVSPVVDTTGAGDAFVGALAFFCARLPDQTTDERIRRACCVAADSVRRAGTQISYPRRQDLAEDLFK